MTAHIIVEAVEPNLPATLSKTILQGILREQLRYRGLIITDDMEMKAIADHFGSVDAPLKALEAGADILLYHTEPVEVPVFEGLMSKLTSPEGAEALKNLQLAAKRVEEFKKKHFLPYKPVYIPEIASIIGSPQHLALAQKLEKLSESIA